MFEDEAWPIVDMLEDRRCDVHELAVQHETIRHMVAQVSALTPIESEELGRLVNGLPLRSKSEDNARQRVKDKLRAAA